MRRRLPLLAVLAAALGTLPASASAAILDVRIDTAAGPALCVSTNALASSVTVIVGRPGGGALTSVVTATPQATLCDGGAGRSFRPALPFGGLDGAAGATLAIADSTGDSVTVPFPVASFETGTAGFSGRLHLRNLPAVGGTQITNGGSLPVTGVSSGTYDSAGEIASPGSTVTVSSTIAGTPFRADVAPHAFAADATSADGATAVRVHGADPSGGPVAIELISAPAGSSLAATSAPARIGSGLDATATLPLAARSGAVVIARQGAWTTSTQFGSAGFTADGFSVSVVPSPSSCAAQHTCTSGTYDWSLALHDPAASPGATDAEGPCHALGPDVSGASGCGAFPPGARLAATSNGELPVVDDTVTLTMTGASLGTSSLRVTAPGVRGSLDDGSLHVRGTRRQPVMASISSPRGALPPLKATRTLLTNASGVADLGPERNPFTLRVGDGATVSLSGAGIGSVPLTFSYRLAASLSGGVLSGSASPGARVLVAQDQGTRIDEQVVTAAGSGAFAATLRDPAPGDHVVVSAGDLSTHGVTTLSLIVGGLVPRIQGLADQQPVRAGATAGVAGLSAGSSVLWGGDLPETLGGTSFTLPVDRVPDGPARVTATAVAGPSLTDYLYVLVDSTAPTGGAGPDQTVPVGRRAVFVTQAHDANGLAAVRFRFTTKGNGVGQPVNQLGQPFRHAFTKVGTYAVTVTITDLAGNTTTDRAIVRVVRGLASSITGRWPARATRRAGIGTKLSARIPGDLSLELIRADGRVAVSRTLSFDKARVGKKVKISLRRVRPGRYLVVRQFVDANGVAGPVVATPLVIA